MGFRGAVSKVNVMTSDAATSTMDIKVWAGTVLSNTSGAWSVDISKTGFTKILSVTATAQLDTTTAATVPMAGIRSYTIASVTGWVVQSNAYTIVIGGSGNGLRFSTTPTVIHVQVIGI